METIKMVIIVLAIPVVMFWGFILLLITTKIIAEIFMILPFKILMSFFAKDEIPKSKQPEKPQNLKKPKIIPPGTKL